MGGAKGSQTIGAILLGILTIADAYGDVPADMQKRLRGGEKVGE